jgi:hypothetical protein
METTTTTYRVLVRNRVFGHDTCLGAGLTKRQANAIAKAWPSDPRYREVQGVPGTGSPWSYDRTVGVYPEWI